MGFTSKHRTTSWKILIWPVKCVNKHLEEEHYMFGFIKKLFGSKPAEVTAEAPYKVEVPTLTEVVAAPAPVAEVKAEPAKPAPKKKPAAKKPAGQKPAPKQAGAKKGGRKPKAKPAV